MVKKRLEELDVGGNGKLSPKAFITTLALQYGQTDSKRCAKLSAKLNAKPDQNYALGQFLRLIVALYRKPEITRPIPLEKFGKFARVYGASEHGDPLAQLSSLGFGLGDFFVLAAKRAVHQHEGVFGIVDDPDALDHELVELRQKYADLLAEIEASITGAEIEFDADSKRPIVKGTRVPLQPG